jgi:hypothetical protein
MKNRLVGLLVLLVGSEVLGVLFGNLFFRLFNHTVPPAVLTSFNKSTAHAAFLAYGLLAGLIVFLWGLVAIAGSKIFRGKSKQAGQA